MTILSMRNGVFCAVALIISISVESSPQLQDNIGKLPWNEQYKFIYEIPPITFHYHHGFLAGSYPAGVETTDVSFHDVSKFLGHICLCGAGGFMITSLAVDYITSNEEPLERGEFTLISSRDHTVSDVIAFILGCNKRNIPEANQYFIDTGIDSPRREYHYFIGYNPEKKAVHIIYRKHLLVGNEEMDRLWEIEQNFDRNPGSVDIAELEMYRNAMLTMVKDVLLERKADLFEVEAYDYQAFEKRIEQLKKNR